MAAALSVEGLTLRFGGVTALAGVDLTLSPGEALGLIGPNGSGKSSLLNILSGHLRAGAGRILLDGARIDGLPPERIAARGVARSFQSLRLLQRLDLLENLRAACHACAPGREALWQSRVAARAERDRLLSLLALFGLERHAHDLPAALTPVQLRQVEIARVLAAAPRLVLLDEPAAGMTPSETERMAEVLAAHLLPGRSVIVIEHKTGFVADLCPRIAVLDQGRKIADGPARAVLSKPQVRQSFFGAAGC